MAEFCSQCRGKCSADLQAGALEGQMGYITGEVPSAGSKLAKGSLVGYLERYKSLYLDKCPDPEGRAILQAAYDRVSLYLDTIHEDGEGI